MLPVGITCDLFLQSGINNANVDLHKQVMNAIRALVRIRDESQFQDAEKRFEADCKGTKFGGKPCNAVRLAFA